MKKLFLLLALLALLLVLWFCTNSHGPIIEDDLSSRVSTALSGENIGDLNVSADIRHITLAGTVNSKEGKERAVALAKEVYGVKSVKDELSVIISTPPADYESLLLMSGNTIVLEGNAPSIQAKQNLLHLIKSAQPNADIVDRMNILAEAPSGWSDAMGASVQQLSMFSQARIRLFNRSLNIEGDVASEEEYQAIISAMSRAIGQKYDMNPNIQILKPEPAQPTLAPEQKQAAASCQKQFRDALASDTVRFKIDSADIQSVSQALLNSLADITAECPDAEIEIAGHTDSSGDAKYNQNLSEARAASVKRYLIRRGVSPEKLSSRGYGESRPVAENITAQGRAANRRIELNVKGI